MVGAVTKPKIRPGEWGYHLSLNRKWGRGTGVSADQKNFDPENKDGGRGGIFMKGQYNYKW